MCDHGNRARQRHYNARERHIVALTLTPSPHLREVVPREVVPALLASDSDLPDSDLPDSDPTTLSHEHAGVLERTGHENYK